MPPPRSRKLQPTYFFFLAAGFFFAGAFLVAIVVILLFRFSFSSQRINSLLDVLCIRTAKIIVKGKSENDVTSSSPSARATEKIPPRAGRTHR